MFKINPITGKPEGRPAIDLTEKQIRYAMSMTSSNLKAADFLNVAYTTWKKYAKLYIDEETNKTLFELHKKKYGVKLKEKKQKGIRTQDRRGYDSGYKQKLDDILEGKYPWYQPRLLRKRLFLSNKVPLICCACGWSEGRIGDGNVPLLLNFKDGNWRNKLLENIELLCFNCYFLRVGSQGHYWQGMSYGTKNKKRADGRPTQHRKNKKDNNDIPNQL
jgi:hypothetical protein